MAAGEPIQEMLAADDEKFKKNLKYLAIGALVLSITGFMFSGQRGSISQLTQRPEYGLEASDFPVKVDVSYKDQHFKYEDYITVPAKELTPAQAQRKLKECEEWVYKTVLGNEEMPVSITKSLELPEFSEDGAVQIVWESSKPERLSSEGVLNAVGLRDTETLILKAIFIIEDYTREKLFTLRVCEEDIRDYSESLKAETGEMLRSLKDSTASDKLILPDKTANGADVTWALPGKQFPFEIAAFGMLIGLMLLFTRHDGLEKRLKKLQKEFEMDLPDLNLQLILLLNAGLVAGSAFNELAVMNKDSKSPLYKAIYSLKRQSEETNIPFVNTLYTYAAGTGCREFIRFANLVMDSSGKGSELADKLERERAQQWGNRLNTAKARAKEAETKLCLPLTLLLMVLVVISISPALLDM